MKKTTPPKSPLLTKPLALKQLVKIARRNLLEIFPEMTLRQKIVSGRLIRKKWHLIMSKEANQRILSGNIANYPKSFVMRNLLRPSIGDGLILAEGASWRWQRRTAAPVFSPRNLKALTPLMSLAATRSIERLKASNGKIEMFDEMLKATFEVIVAVCFSPKDEYLKRDIHAAIDKYVKMNTVFSMYDMMGLPSWFPRPNGRYRKKTIQNMKRLADEVIKERQNTHSTPPYDFLDLLLQSEDPKSARKMTAKDIRDNLLTFIVAGHVTTTITLAWAFYLLAFDEDAQTRLYQEASDALQGGIAGDEHQEKLPFTEQVVKETLRLYPAVAVISRVAKNDDILDGVKVKKGDIIILPIYLLHRNHLLWDNPDHFDPNRFAPHKKIERYAYMPFIDGPRTCIGAQFAISEAKIILATLVSKFKFEIDETHPPPRPMTTLTLRPEGGVHLKITER